MKVRITRLYFDGLKRVRPGSVIEISNDRWKQGEKIPATSRKKIGDLKEFAPSCMELVDEDTSLVSTKRPKVITSETLSNSDQEVI